MESKELLAFIDSMDLNEDFINNLLKKIMTRTSFTTKHMENALRFLKYKLAVNQEESLFCSNEQEYEFIGKLIKDMSNENIGLLCAITNTVLQLDPTTIVSKAEHLLQQIFSEIALPSFKIVPAVTDNETDKALLDLKLASSIMEAVISQKKKVVLMFLQVPLENMVFSPNKKIVSFFYSMTIPHFYSGVFGFPILDRLWMSLKGQKEFQIVTLNTISCLADYYLPIADELHKQCSLNTIAADVEFWATVLFGLQSADNTLRKKAVYLIKRALDSLTGTEKVISVNTEDMVIAWDKKNERMYRTMWDNFFILIDSLEEVQSNIVLPSLKLFESVKHLGHCWLCCAYKIGLQHDNASVRLHCIMYRLEIQIENTVEALTLLNALNDINLYEHPLNTKVLKTSISKALEEKQTFMNILEAVPLVKWSPVPLYYLSETLGEVIYPSLLLNVEHKKVCTIINDILRIPCNSPVIKKAIYGHVSNFIVNCCKGFIWEDYVSIYPNMHAEVPINSFIMTALATHIKKNLYLSDIDKTGLAEAMSTSCENINIGLLYLSAHEQDGVNYLLSIIGAKIEKIIDICNRPHGNKAQCIADINFMISMYSTTAGRPETYMVVIHCAIVKQYKIILQYLSTLLTTSVALDNDAVTTLYDNLKNMPISEESLKDNLLEIYKTSVLLLIKEDSPMHRKTCAVSIMNYLVNNQVMDAFYRNEMLSLEQFLVTVKNIGRGMNIQCNGKMKNIFYEKSCEIVLSYLKVEPNAKDVVELFAFVEKILDCGGYGCLKFILRIVNKIISRLIDNKSVTFDLSVYLSQTWMQVCELKTNREYIACVDDYVKLITQDLLLQHPVYNTVVINYYSTIIDLAVTKRMPLYFLVKHLSTKRIIAYDNMVHVISNILLYAIVPKKDQRITENLCVDLFSKMQGIIMTDMNIFSQHIQILSVSVLSKVTDIDKLNEISDLIMAEIDQILKAKPRYHSHNTTHRKLLRALQTLLVIFLKTRQVDVKKTATWCMNLLRLSHDVSVKIYIFWYIALYIYSADITIDGELMCYLSQNGVPLICQFTIVYYIMRHKIANRTHYDSETEFVLDFLLSHTMGPVFGVRLTAQYYAMTLLETSSIKKKIEIDKYRNLNSILTKTLGGLAISKDNALKTLWKDYFTESFDIVGDLTLIFIYYSLQRRCEQFNEIIDTPFAIKVFSEIEELFNSTDHDAFFVEWKGTCRWHAFSHCLKLSSTSQMHIQEDPSTIQKKYVPWRSMTDLDMDKYRRNSRRVTDLIVVASLVNRAPNLGGLARTCEVFGVSCYVIDNLRYVADRQFQSLSVSADRWVNIEEVRAGRPLKDYLQRKKREGYSIVAAEQTSSSRPLNEFRFPKKSIIMLGNEKEGIPPYLLPLMDFCVEIPQRGVVRSLNVHVSASIFIWEYCRQYSIRSLPPYLK